MFFGFALVKHRLNGFSYDGRLEFQNSFVSAAHTKVFPEPADELAAIVVAAAIISHHSEPKLREERAVHGQHLLKSVDSLRNGQVTNFCECTSDVLSANDRSSFPKGIDIPLDSQHLNGRTTVGLPPFDVG